MKELDQGRLKKLLLIALSSEQPGEAAAALAKVRKTLTAAGYDIYWLADKLTGEAPEAEEEPYHWPPASDVPWQEMLIFCVDHRPYLRHKEEGFIGSLLSKSTSHYGWQPTDKQMAWLSDIYRRLKSFP